MASLNSFHILFKYIFTKHIKRVNTNSNILEVNTTKQIVLSIIAHSIKSINIVISRYDIAIW